MLWPTKWRFTLVLLCLSGEDLLEKRHEVICSYSVRRYVSSRSGVDVQSFQLSDQVVLGGINVCSFLSLKATRTVRRARIALVKGVVWRCRAKVMLANACEDGHFAV